MPVLSTVIVLIISAFLPGFIWSHGFLPASKDDSISGDHTQTTGLPTRIGISIVLSLIIVSLFEIILAMLAGLRLGAASLALSILLATTTGIIAIYIVNPDSLRRFRSSISALIH